MSRKTRTIVQRNHLSLFLFSFGAIARKAKITCLQLPLFDWKHEEFSDKERQDMFLTRPLLGRTILREGRECDRALVSELPTYPWLYSNQATCSSGMREIVKCTEVESRSRCRSVEVPARGPVVTTKWKLKKTN